VTTPVERSRAVTEVRWFLQTLAEAREPIDVPGLVQSVAAGLLRHYPLEADLVESAAALPEVWAAPRSRGSRLRLVRGSRD
jgi:hypothetical protein